MPPPWLAPLIETYETEIRIGKLLLQSVPSENSSRGLQLQTASAAEPPIAQIDGDGARWRSPTSSARCGTGGLPLAVILSIVAADVSRK
jgi:hypothetical protein